VLVNLLDVLGSGQAQAFIGLGHEVADEDADSACVGQRSGNAIDQKIGDERGVERARAHGDEVGAGDRVQRFFKRSGIRRIKRELDNTAAAGGDVGFTADH
jgi:hypothetical protein